MSSIPRARSWISCLGWLILVWLLGFTVYLPSIRIQHYADDFQFYFDPPPPSLAYYFMHPNPNNLYAYRPLEALSLVAVQQAFGMDTLPLHLAQITLHALLSWLVFVWMLRTGLPKRTAAISSLFMLLSQANVHAVASNDTLSQILGTLFGSMSAWLLDDSITRAANTPQGAPRFLGVPGFASSVLCFGLALVSKETSISFLPIIALILWSRRRTLLPRSLRLRQLGIRFGFYLTLVAVYAGIRSRLALTAPAAGDGPASFLLGTNVIRNMGLFLIESVLPGSSVRAYVALVNRLTLPLVTMALGMALFSICVLYGLRRQPNPRLWALIGTFALLGVFPVVFMSHVSELYIYNSMPFVSILVGAGLGRFLELCWSRAGRRLAVLSLLAAVFFSHVEAVRSKIGMMEANGERSALLLRRLEPFLKEIPRNGELVLLNPNSAPVEYSIFLMNGFHVLRAGWFQIYRCAGRSDFDIRVVRASAWPDAHVSSRALVLSLDPVDWTIRRAP